MKDLRRIVYYTLIFFLLAFNTQKPLFGQQESKTLFEDSMTKNWQKYWFLDGQKATLEHRNNGLYFSGVTITKNDDPENYHMLIMLYSGPNRCLKEIYGLLMK